MSTPLSVAVLSFWHVHAPDYARSVQNHPGTTLTAVWDNDDERGKAGADQFGVPYTADLDALLAREDIDAVTVTTSTDLHHEIMLKAIAAGKHIFTEKMLAPTVAEAEEIVAAAAARGVKLVVSLPRLYEGLTLTASRLIAEGKLGEKIGGGVANAQLAAGGGDQADRRVQVRAGNRAEDGDQHEQDRARRQRVAEQGDGIVPA